MPAARNMVISITHILYLSIYKMMANLEMKSTVTSAVSADSPTL